MSETTYSLDVRGYDGDLKVVRFAGREAMNELYAFSIEVTTRDLHRPLDRQLLGSRASFTIAHDDSERPIHGVIHDIELMDVFGSSEKRRVHYRLHLAPRLWLLTQQQNSRVFQNRTIQEIVDAVLGDTLVPSHWMLVHEYPAREMCIQYEETDFAFISRILSEVGIFFFFDQVPSTSIRSRFELPIEHAIGAAAGALGAQVPTVPQMPAVPGMPELGALGETLLRGLGAVPHGDVVVFADDPLHYPFAGEVGDSLLALLEERITSVVGQAGAALGGTLGQGLGSQISDTVAAVGNSIWGGLTDRGEPPQLRYRPHTEALAQPDNEFVYSFVRRGRLRPVKSTFRDVDARRPRTPVSHTHTAPPSAIQDALQSLGLPIPDAITAQLSGAAEAGLNAATNAVGQTLPASAAGGIDALRESLLAKAALNADGRRFEIYEHHSSHLRPASEHYAVEPRRVVNTHRRDAVIALGESAYHRMSCGHVIALRDHPLDWLNTAYVMVAVEHRGQSLESSSDDQDGNHYHNTFTCVPRQVPYPPERQSRRTVQGCVTATVVDRADEIHTHDFTMVKVQFHWDRLGSGRDTTCWIRTMQASAGAGWGTQFIPRVGNEVVVGFDGGDIDRPIVLGCLYNAVNPPPFKLPEHKTRSGIRTRSVPDGNDGNELSFEDRAGQEQVLLRATRNWDSVVAVDRSLDVGRDEQTAVGANQTLTVAGEQTVRVTGSRSLEIAQSDSQQVGGNQSLAVRGTRNTRVASTDSCVVGGAARLQVHGDYQLGVGGDRVLRCGNNTTVVGSSDQPGFNTVRVEGRSSVSARVANELSSEQEVTLRCGNSYLRLTPDSVELGSKRLVFQGEHTRIVLDQEDLRMFAPGLLQGIGESNVLLNASGSGLALGEEASLDGSRVLLNSPNSAEDPHTEEAVPPTEFELVDDEGNPIPNRPYRIVLADGSSMTGVLDSDGRASLTLEQGGQITFPGLSDITPR